MKKLPTTATTSRRVSSINRELASSLVKVENDEGRLRLRFSYGGKRYAMAIGLPDFSVNRMVAQQKASQIELDIASGNFDSTLPLLR